MKPPSPRRGYRPHPNLINRPARGLSFCWWAMVPPLAPPRPGGSGKRPCTPDGGASFLTSSRFGHAEADTLAAGVPLPLVRTHA